MARRVTKLASPRSERPAPTPLPRFPSLAVPGKRSSDSEIVAVTQIRRGSFALDEMSAAIKPSLAAPRLLPLPRVEPTSAVQASARLTSAMGPRDVAPVFMGRSSVALPRPTPAAACERPVLPPMPSRLLDVLALGLAWMVTAGAGAVIAGHVIARSQPPLILRAPFAAAAIVGGAGLSAAPSCPKSWEPPLAVRRRRALPSSRRRRLFLPSRESPTRTWSRRGRGCRQSGAPPSVRTRRRPRSDTRTPRMVWRCAPRRRASRPPNPSKTG